MNLLAGSIISGKYEVIEMLAKDDFEILYLVRDIHRKGSFFVLKELFLETFSSRRDQAVYTVPEAEGVFNKRKRQIIEEMEAQKLNLNLDEIKVYGYEEDNETIYTIMEFSHNAPLEKYLQFIPKGSSHLPSLKELVKLENKNTNSFFFIKILLLLGTLLALAFYGYQYFQKNSLERSLEKLETSVNIDTPKLKDRKVEENISIEIEVNETIEILALMKEEEANASVEISEKKITEKNITIVNEINLSEENLTVESVADDVNHSIAIESTIESTIKNFLDAYINASSNASVEDTLIYYDSELKRYFKFRNVNHQLLAKKQKRYNRKWIKREFKIVDFEIIKTYEKDKTTFYDIKTITVWNVSNSRGKKASGKSKGLMILKEVEDGFKITAIHGLK